jgi:hypothetical protein
MIQGRASVFSEGAGWVSCGFSLHDPARPGTTAVVEKDFVQGELTALLGWLSLYLIQASSVRRLWL